jgi:DNA (cytosine-5)-methyltransferase 1
MPSNPHSWNLTDLANVPANNLKVFSTFACGGGSSMGYKLAGFNVIGANDIDPEMRWHYEKNLNPKIFIEAPVKDLTTMDLPEDLFDLDVLDGSPPCSTFSMAGSREKAWGKEKHFREGQAVQVLDDLFFDFLDVAERLKPKVIVAENVKGMLAGQAKGYVHAVIQRLKEIGYKPQLFLVNSADCGVPQRRERVFFVASREDLDLPPLTYKPTHKWITAGEACEDIQILTPQEIDHTSPSNLDLRYWHLTAKGRNYSVTAQEIAGKNAYWNSVKLNDQTPAPTITAGDGLKHWDECRALTYREVKRLGSFPDDYQAKSDNIGKYMVGMSVPPKMMEPLARAIAEQWFGVSDG